MAATTRSSFDRKWWICAPRVTPASWATRGVVVPGVAVGHQALDGGVEQTGAHGGTALRLRPPNTLSVDFRRHSDRTHLSESNSTCGRSVPFTSREEKIRSARNGTLPHRDAESGRLRQRYQRHLHPRQTRSELFVVPLRRADNVGRPTRSMSSRRTALLSIRARLAPRHRWIPEAERDVGGLRSATNASGLSNCRGSWLARPRANRARPESWRHRPGNRLWPCGRSSESATEAQLFLDRVRDRGGSARTDPGSETISRTWCSRLVVVSLPASSNSNAK